MGRLGWGFGRISKGTMGSFLVMLDLRFDDVSKIRFWNDVWCGDKALKVAFPR
jgi:hypothetical protein